MGIHGLSKVLGDHAPGCMKENEIKNYFGRKVAVDASMCIYQFLIAVRQDGSQLTNEDGETTSHLMGMFYRTIRMVENGIKPVYVFDGKPPEMKSGELEKRKERREEAEKALAQAEEAGDTENVEKFNRRLVKVTKQHNEECKELLKLMGIPYVDAPCEAEAQCAALVKAGKVWATGTEDMDSLTFGSNVAPCEAEAQCAALVKAGKVWATGTEDMDSLTFGSNVVLRHLTFSEARKMPIKEYHYDKVIEELELSKDQFIDLCILLGCDYCESIRGIGPKRAVDLIKQHKCIEDIIKNLDSKKYTVPEDWMFKEARELFQSPEVTDPETIDLKWQEPKVDDLVDFMVNKKQFSEDRIRNGIKKLEKARTGTTQGRIDGFFKVLQPASTTPKRKAEDSKGGQKKKAKGNFKRPK